MELGLAGKCAFVSGASSGIGREIALELAREGVSVAVHGRDRDRTEETVRDVQALGVKAAAVIGDLTLAADCESVAKESLAALGSIDIVVNNAGVALRQDNPGWDKVPFETYEESFQLNFMAALRMSRHFLPCFEAAHWGRIVNISTYGSLMGGMMSDYTSAKAALNKLTVDMSKQVGQFGATANAILPGIIMTPQIERFLGVLKDQMGWDGGLPEWEKRYLNELVPQSVQRIGRPADVAKCTAFLASDAAGYITGVLIRMNGGSGADV